MRLTDLDGLSLPWREAGKGGETGLGLGKGKRIGIRMLKSMDCILGARGIFFSIIMK